MRAAPYLLGKDPLEIERHWQALDPFLGINGTGAENRGRSTNPGVGTSLRLRPTSRAARARLAY